MAALPSRCSVSVSGSGGNTEFTNYFNFYCTSAEISDEAATEVGSFPFRTSGAIMSIHGDDPEVLNVEGMYHGSVATISYLPFGISAVLSTGTHLSVSYELYDRRTAAMVTRSYVCQPLEMEVVPDPPMRNAEINLSFRVVKTI